MTQVINATGDGACLFNAVAIGLGIEILSGRLDGQKDSPGYQRLLEEFALHHSNFKPATWDILKQWLAFYNDSRDIELIFSPVLFNLNKHYQDSLDLEILNELTNLIRDNKELIVNDSPFYSFNVVNCPKIDNLSVIDKAKLLKQLKPIIKEWNTNQDFSAVKALVKQHTDALFKELSKLIKSDPSAFQRGYSCGDLKGLSNALSLSLIDIGIENPADKNTKLRLENKQQHWNVLCDDHDAKRLINATPRKLDKITSLEAYKGGLHIASPTLVALAPKVKSDVLISEENVDNPGLGNCAFYAFAVGLINIIQNENEYGKRDMFLKLLKHDSSLAGLESGIKQFDFNAPNAELLNQLQSSLRLVAYHYQIRELKQACAQPDNHYTQLVANSNFVNFAALYYGLPEDTNPHFNKLAKSKALLIAVGEIDRSTVEENQENLTLVPLFIRLMYGETTDPKSIKADTNPSVTSPIIAAMANITQDFYRGVHLDLDYLAIAFGVNLHVTRNGVPVQEFKDIKEQHTITLRNLGNYHWTTDILTAHKLKEIPAVGGDNDDDKIGDKKKNLEQKQEAGLKKQNEAAEQQKKKQEAIVFGVKPDDEQPSIIKPVDSDVNKLARLKATISDVTKEYTSYNESVWYSIFHRHGKAGRVRAAQFNEEFGNITNYGEAKKKLVQFLNDSKNGNTHPHSYRTMLLNELHDGGAKPSLQNTSKQFSEQLASYAGKLGISALRKQLNSL